MNNLPVLIGQIKRGNTSRLIVNKENVNNVDANRKTLLMYAAEYGRVNIFNQLIELNAEIEKQDSNGYNALMYVAEKKEMVDERGKIEIVTILIENNCDIKAKNNKGFTALILALKTNDDETITRIILDADRDQNRDYINAKENEEGKTALIYAVGKGYNFIVKELLKKDADIKIMDLYGQNALMHASLYQKPAVANLILEDAKKKKMEIEKYVNLKDAEGKTALILDVIEYNPDPDFENKVLEIAKLLIENKADINSQDNEGYTSLMYASINGMNVIIEFLLENGADYEIINHKEDTALILAAENGNAESVDILLINEADINYQGADNMTALISAVYNDFPSVMETILEYNPDVDIQDGYGKTALMYACEKEDEEMVEKLLEHNPDINILRDNEGKTALMYAQNSSKILSMIKNHRNPAKKRKRSEDYGKRKSLRKPMKRSLRKSKRKSLRKPMKRSSKKSRRRSLRKSRKRSSKNKKNEFYKNHSMLDSVTRMNNHRQKPLTPFFIYMLEQEYNYKKEFPNLSYPQLTQKMSEDWRVLEIKEKKVYNIMAAKMLKEYKSQL